jgi:Protein of unknown function (DUF1566)
MPKHFLRSFSAVFALASMTLQTASFAQTCNPNTTPSAPTSQFTVHGNGTVTHKRTGLMWKVCSEGQTWSQPVSSPSCDGMATTHTFLSAITSVAESHSFASYDDWRMPSVQELQSIVESCRGAPTNNTVNNIVFPDTPSANFWSGSPYANALFNDAWRVSFNDGGSSSQTRGTQHHIRLVRGAQALGSSPFLANGHCGPAAYFPGLLEPTTGLCADWSVPFVTRRARTFTWECRGAINATSDETGATVGCSMLRQFSVTASPNPANAGGRLDCMATDGSALGATAPVDHNQTATCLATPDPGHRTARISGCSGTATTVGVNTFTSGAVTADCAVTASFELIPAPAANGVCGSAQNAFSQTAPTANLCTSTAGNGAVSQVGINWNWSCAPINGGVPANCSAPATACTMDIDGDGFVNTQIDALIHARIAAGMVGSNVLNGFTIPLNAARRDWPSIRDHLVNRCGMTLP